MAKLTFEAEWHGEMAAGIRPGSETVTIEFVHTSEFDADTIEYFQDVIREYFDGASVQLVNKNVIRKEN